MDRAQGPVEEKSGASPQTPKIDFAVDPKSQVGVGLVSATTGIVDRRLGAYNLPLGAPGRNPASPIPLETNPGALEVGKSPAD
jgi:hypothetical protein